MSTAIQSPPTNPDAETLDPREAEVQRILAVFGAAAPEVQTLVMTRLLSGLAAKLPSGAATKAIEVAKVPPGQKPPRRERVKPPEPNYEPQLKKLDDPFDPLEAWEKLGGAPGLQTILPYEATGILEAMLRHPNMPPGPKPKSSAKPTLAKTIIARLATHYQQR